MRKRTIEPVLEVCLGSAVGQCRAAPVRLGPGAPRAVLAVYAGCFDVDPYVEMFFFPTDTLKLVLFDQTGAILWRRDLGSGVVPGIWFCPVLPFDADGDGVDEIYYVNNTCPEHPLGTDHYVLERLNASTGATTGQWPWPQKNKRQDLSHAFRNFLTGGYVRGEPVLVSAQGTYESMHLQGRRPDMSLRWELDIPAGAPGARGSHMCPVADINVDGVDELLWGERCIELDKGTELFCADRDTYSGHSDIVIPVLDRHSGQWLIYTARESDRQTQPRVALFDSSGRRIWGAVDEGHMDMGWVARLDGERELVAQAVRVGAKVCGPDGRFHSGITEFHFDLLSGAPLELGFSTYRTLPVDIDGDGFHELVRGQASGDGELLDGRGRVLAQTRAPSCMVSRFLDLPGEQILAYYEDGTLRAWADRDAVDSPAFLARLASPAYETNQRLTITGYNLMALCGV